VVFAGNPVVSLCAGDRVTISRQDGSGWAVAVGCIAAVLPGPVVKVTLDKAVSCNKNILYRIDRAPGFASGMSYYNMADLCLSDSER